ncbi:MAG: M23 family metallopeptidase [Chloroflexota bacterium]
MAKKVSPVTGQSEYPGAGWIITSGYATDEYFQRFGSWHTGHDLATSNVEGKPAFAAMDGKVKWAEFAGDNGFGNLVYIEHSPTLYTRYGHLNSIHVQRNQEVTAGTPIGTIGKTGRVTGAHLHFDISRINNALDWPGLNKALVLQNYIDPKSWYADTVTAVVEPVVTQWLYVIAPAGLRIRTKPSRTSRSDASLPYGAAVQVTGVRIAADGFQWREVISGGWIAEAWTQTSPPPAIVSPVGEVTPIATPLPAAPTPVFTPGATITIGLRGVHASAGGWAPSNREIELVRHNRVESVFIAAYEANQAQTAISSFRNAGVQNFIIRAAGQRNHITRNPDDFVNDTLPRLREYYNLIGNGMMVAVHNEPNITPEGWTTAWNNGGEFTQWFLKVAQAYRSALPGVKIGFPALSPGGDAPGLREDEWRFAGESRQAIAASDWVGVHAYFTGGGDDIDVKPDLWRGMAQGRTVIITEGGPADTIRNDGAKLSKVYAKCASLGIPVMAWLLSGAGAWASAGWDEQDVRIP